MKILIIVDKQGTAIDRLAQSIRRNLPHHQIIVAPVHPKRNDIETLVEAQKLMIWADVIDIHYWRSGQVLRTSFPAEFNAKPKILFHFNPYDATSEENQFYDMVVVGNKEIHTKVPSAHLIPYCIDLSFFKFNPEYTQENKVMMSVNRIEGKKGVLEVAKACKELGYPFVLVGRVSKADYMKEVMEAGGDNIEFWENATDEKLREIYYQSAVHVCNSVDAYESGTLPILEAMACGVPVLTRMIGHVPDISNGSNMVVRVGQVSDMEDLKAQLKEMMENRAWRISLREKAWDSARVRDDRRMALDVQKLYYSIFQKEGKLVSVIIPTKDNPQAFSECLLSVVAQDYPFMEIVIADSGEVEIRKIVNEVKKQTSIPIKYIQFDRGGRYSLGEARNRAVIEADGQLLVFCDDRIRMLQGAVQAFVNYHRPKSWLWGMKDGVVKGFVENFSCISREDLIKHGMFSERMQWYGGTTQELRTRFEDKNNMDFIFVDDAKAEGIKKSKSKNARREDIIDAKFLVHKLYGK